MPLETCIFKGVLGGRWDIFKSKGKGSHVGGQGPVGQASVETDGGLCPPQDVSILCPHTRVSNAPHPPGSHSRQAAPLGGVAQGPELCSELPLCLPAGSVSCLWLWWPLSGPARRNRVGPRFRAQGLPSFTDLASREPTEWQVCPEFSY